MFQLIPYGQGTVVGTAFLLALAYSSGAQSAVIAPGDFGGGDLTLMNGDIIAGGAYTNIGNFTIANSVTVTLAPGATFNLSATNIAIAGNLDGSGSGGTGGASVPNSSALGGPTGRVLGNAGNGPGGGGSGLYGNGIHGSGGGGGGYGGTGGIGGAVFTNDPPGGPGGAAYGDASSMTIQAGSGGGSGSPYGTDSGGASGEGGDGGGVFTLMASNVLDLDGSIIADGTNGGDGVPFSVDFGTSAGGGGSGGGILLTAALLDLDGLLSAAGGDGGDGSMNAFGAGGGGGAGGRIKLFFGSLVTGAGFATDVTGGTGGTSRNTATDPSTPGDSGTVFSAVLIPEPGTLAIFGLGLVGLGLSRLRKAAV